MEFDLFKETIKNETRALNLNITDNQIEKFYNYMNLLLAWNEKINLTAITDPNEIITKHFIDSLTICKYLRPEDKIVDIGTGAGFPGIPLKIMNETNEIVLIDSLNKRIKFLEEVIAKENLQGINAVHARVEEIGHIAEYRQKFDVVTSRAVAKLNVLLEYMLPFTKIGGRCICLKGPNADEEIKEAENALNLLGGKINNVEKLTLPSSNDCRTIIEVLAVKHLPNRFPRKPGTPTSSPL